MSDNHSAMLKSLKLLAIANAIWIAPGLIPYTSTEVIPEIAHTSVGWVSSILAFIFMIRAAKAATQTESFEPEQ